MTSIWTRFDGSDFFSAGCIMFDFDENKERNFCILSVSSHVSTFFNLKFKTFKKNMETQVFLQNGCFPQSFCTITKLICA